MHPEHKHFTEITSNAIDSTLRFYRTAKSSTWNPPMRMRPRLSDLTKVAVDCILKAKKVSESLNFSEEVVKYAKEEGRITANLSLSDEPKLANLDVFYGVVAWAAVLSVDLRDSTRLALAEKAKKTFVTMHTYMPVMLRITQLYQGRVIGLRGDGLIACFGKVDLEGDRSVLPQEAESAVTTACDWGDAMVKAMDLIVNPILASQKLRADLKVGVGIDVGNIVITNIGFGTATDLTAYGDAVNHACKFSEGNGKVILSHKAKGMFPTEKDGRTGFKKYGEGYVLDYPSDYKTIIEG